MLQIKHKYDAAITDCGVTQNKDGEAQPFVKFDVVDESGVKHPMTWFASLKTPDSTRYAVNKLVEIGFKGEDFSDLNKGIVIFEGTLKLTVELEHPQKDGVEQKDKFRIKYINTKSAGLTKFQGTVPSQVALFRQIRAELGVKKTKPTTTTQGEW